MTNVPRASPSLCTALYNVPQLQPNAPTLEATLHDLFLSHSHGKDRRQWRVFFCDGNTCQAADKLRWSQRSMNSHLTVMTDSCCHVPDQNNNLELKGSKYRSLEPQSCFNFKYCFKVSFFNTSFIYTHAFVYIAKHICICTHTVYNFVISEVLTNFTSM